MTVQNTDNRVQMMGDGSTKQFDFSFPIIHKSDLKVYVGDVLQALDSTYSVRSDTFYPDGVTYDFRNGGYVLFEDTHIPEDGALVTIIREIEPTQGIDLVPGGVLPADVLEQGFDKLTMLIQQIVASSLRLSPLTDPSTINPVLPVGEADKTIGWDSSGENLANLPYPFLKIQYSEDGESWHDTLPEANSYVRFSVDDGTTWGTAWYIRGEQGNPGDNAPEVLFQFSVNGSTGWHSPFVEGDLYCRVSTDGGSTWSGGIKFVGDDGADGDVVGPVSSTDGNFASWDGTGGNTLKDSGKKPADFLESFDVIDDTTPQLGGNLDVNGKTFTQTASAKYEFGTDEKQVDFNSNNAHFTLVNNTTGTAIDWRKGNKQTIAPTTAPTYTFTAPGGACNLILKLTQYSTAVTITWPATVKWCGSTPAFDTNSGVYIICFFYDGTNYYGTSVEEVTA